MARTWKLIAFLNFLLISLGQTDNPVEETNMSILEASPNSHKITKGLKLKFLQSAAADSTPKTANIMIEFEGANSKAIQNFKDDSSGFTRATISRGEKISVLVDNLQAHALDSQSEVLEFLESEGVDHIPLWAANEIYVRDADPRVISEIASRFGNVAKIRPVALLQPPKPIEIEMEPNNNAGYNYHPDPVPQPIQQVNGRCEAIGCLGEGAVVAIIDSGVMWTHDELKDNYRKEYGWYDPVNGTELPSISFSHGTHVAGLAVGKTKGVAPKAQWIACKCFRVDVSEEVYLKACGQWALCPFRWNNSTDKDCSMAPDIINNSWNANGDEQQSIPRNFFYGIQEAWNAAGIISFFAAGKAGPYCTTVDPPAMYDISFAIAAVDNTSTAAYFSSRGPVLNMEFGSKVRDPNVSSCKQECSAGQHFGWSPDQEVCTLTKPDLSAPGVKLNSSYTDSNSSYASFSGTSMATPMVSGVAALMVCANKRISKIRLNQARTTQILKTTARIDRINLAEGHLTGRPNNQAKLSNLLCNMALGNICGTYPNNIYGWGEVDACSAVKAVGGK